MQTQKIQIDALPVFNLSDYKTFPNQAGIYIVKSCARILYIGQTINLQQRWAAHHRYKEIKSIDANATLHFLSVDSEDKELLNQIEKNLILELKPELNWARIHSGLDPEILEFYRTKFPEQSSLSNKDFIKWILHSNMNKFAKEKDFLIFFLEQLKVYSTSYCEKHPENDLKVYCSRFANGFSITATSVLENGYVGLLTFDYEKADLYATPKLVRSSYTSRIIFYCSASSKEDYTEWDYSRGGSSEITDRILSCHIENIVREIEWFLFDPVFYKKHFK
jgi:hypothetical protein